MRHIWLHSTVNPRIWTCPGCKTIWVGDVSPTPGRPVMFEQDGSGNQYFQPCRVDHPNRFTAEFDDCETMMAYQIHAS